MTPTTKYLIAGVAGLTVVLAAAGAIAHRAGSHDGGPHQAMRHGGPMGMMGMAGFGFGGPMSRFCRHDGSEMADHMLVRIEHRLKPTDAQKPAFEEFKTATRTAAERMTKACPPAPAADAAAPPSPITRLAEAEAGLEASLDAIKTFRPAAEKFYATLDDAQKAKLTERRRPWHDHRDGRGGKPDGDEAPAEPGNTPGPDAPKPDTRG